ncbi:MAG: hypothetical protein J6X07_06700 [Prevotella sp.]|nr:hypothetical protein [Prevotella sp.]
MSRRQQIEDIIIGSLIASFDDYWPEVRSCVTDDMISDPFNREIVARMRELNAEGKPVNLKTLTGNGTADTAYCLRLAELADEHDFDWLLWKTNLTRRLSGQPACTTTFDKYVTAFISHATRQETL